MGIFKNILKDKPSTKVKKVLVDPSNIDELFDELSELFIKKQRISEYMTHLQSKEDEIRKFDGLDKEDIQKLGVLATKAKDIEEKKQNLKGRLITNNRALHMLTDYEEELPQLIKEMYLCEKKLKESERNIYYLEEEKDDLLAERESLLKGYHFLKIFSIFFVIIIALCLLMTFGLMQALREAIWIYLSGIGCFILAFLGGILYSKDRLERGIQKNTQLQQKAVKYLNKSKISYFHQIRYLNFQYEKLGVDSVAKLEMYYNRYVKNKDNEKKYIQLNRILSETEEQMLEVMTAKGIRVDHIENLEEWILNPKKLNAIKTLKAEKQRNEEQIQALELYQQAIWKEIFAMQEEDTNPKMIQDKINAYTERINSYLAQSKKDA